MELFELLGSNPLTEIASFGQLLSILYYLNRTKSDGKEKRSLLLKKKKTFCDIFFSNSLQCFVNSELVQLIDDFAFKK